jgi:CDP-diacylglycerol--serine O-phosphatidyltransferase
LPSLFTIGNMLLGFYAIVLGLRKDPGPDFRLAALLIFIAAIVDTLDGRIARMTGTESEFGKEYDSLADVVTFGAAPALLTYLWGLHLFDNDAWLIPLFYMVCAATRLARFNVQTKVVDSRYFVGLPVPAAAGTICSILFFAPDNSPRGANLPVWMQGLIDSAALRVWMQVLVATALLLVGVLMVSTFRYVSGKKFDLRKRWSFRALIPIAAIALVIKYNPYAFFLAVAVLYTLSAPVSWLIGRVRGGRTDNAETPEDTAPPPPIPEPGA